jgi:anaphase-promoting complex subunit 6
LFPIFFFISAVAPLEVGHTKLFQALSINPINAHVLELLNLALEASADAGPLARFGGAGQGEEWEGQMRAHVTRESQLKVTKTKEKEKEAESSSRAMFGDMQEGEAGMALE